MGHIPEPSRIRNDAEKILAAQEAYKQRQKSNKPVPFGNAIRGRLNLLTKRQKKGKA